MRKIFTTFFLVAVPLFMRAQTATVNLNQTAQLIRGFGGINHPEWIGDLTPAQRETAFGNGPNQLGMQVLRVFVNEDRNQWNRAVPTALKAQEMGAIVFASPWNPPSHMVELFTRNGKENQKRLRHNMYAAYAQHLDDFVTFMRDNGVNLYAISMQNEPDYADEWTWWTPQECLRFMKENAGSINCRVISPESFQYRKELTDPILNDPQALANMDILGAHLYGTQYSNFPYPLFKQKGQGKELWMTEVYHPNSEANSADRWPEALETGRNIHHAMADAEFQAYVWWYIRRQYSPMKEDGTISKRGYMMAHYSKFVRAGYYRVEATKEPTGMVNLSAYKKDDDVVIVVLNRNTSSRTITINVPGTRVTSWEQYVTTGSKNLSKESNINAGASFQVTLEPQSMVTFVGKAPVGSSVVLTSPENNASFVAPAVINLAATASRPGGSISRVEFYNGTAKLGEDASAPYTYAWSNVAAGRYTITAVAIDNSGTRVTSAPVEIRVNVPQSPYGGTAHKIPGTIQLEEYDLGGNGFAYYDATSGSEVSPVVNFRSDEDVDIENCTDAGGGYNIGYATAGEWLEYTVNVEAAGTYDLELRVACEGTDRTVTVAMDGTAIASNISIPNTSGWQSWQTVTVRNVELTTGRKVMRLTIGETDYVNLNYVTFKAVNVSLPPVVSLTAPSDNASYGSNETVRLSATASDPDGSVSQVDFYAGDLLIGSVSSAPYAIDWSRMNPGTYVLTAVATDDQGVSTTSSPVSVTIRAMQAPFNGVARLVPGRIEAEEYDLGGEGLGYHEANTNGNQGGASFRNDEVDIELTQDGEGGYNIAYILEGEWLQYTVEVMSSGVYDLNLRMAADGAGKTLHVEMDGVDVTGPIQVPNTGGWQVWETVAVSGVNLTAGEHVMRIVFGSDYMNLNYVEFTDVVTGVNTSVGIQVNMFPNPFSSNGMMVRYTGEFTYRITDISGKLVETGSGTNQVMVGTSLDEGIYFLQLEGENEPIVQKIIKR